MGVLLYSAIGVITILVLVKGYPYLYLVVRSKAEIARMNNSCLATGNITSDIAAARDGHANVYLIKGAGGHIAIDAGEKAKVLESSLAQLGILPEEVTNVFLTHTDFDHCGAIEIFKNARVHIAKAEEWLIDGSMKRTFTKYRLRWNNKLRVPYRTMEDGEVLAIGDRKVQSILTPGHTPGSMCFLIDDKYLFTGDTIALEDGRFQRFVDLFTMDGDENVKSIHKLVRTLEGKNVEYVFSAHHGYVDDYHSAAEGW